MTNALPGAKISKQSGAAGCTAAKRAGQPAKTALKKFKKAVDKPQSLW
ncbi:MAG TPA: hypothetical protein H9703_07630 [Candidatus Faecalibacterium faecigallinarum]|uniref:Uncharacterized protein n=1 Tax=Candidatus Faecalibacterium faecigallinarum TaxID=2838577 RepID=A0A9D2P9K0_9FIRM|nr:hypothetical protein [Candidatus Faecalibacterium faecigallinarum]